MLPNLTSATLTIASKTFTVPAEMLQLLRAIDGWKIDNANKAYYVKGDKKIFLASEVYEGYNVLPELQPGEMHFFRYADGEATNCMPANLSVHIRKIADRYKSDNKLKQTVSKKIKRKPGPKPKPLTDDKDAEELIAVEKNRALTLNGNIVDVDPTITLPPAPDRPQQVIPIKIELTVSVKVEK